MVRVFTISFMRCRLLQIRFLVRLIIMKGYIMRLERQRIRYAKI